MPKLVDHEERRQELVEAAWRVINRVGLERTTIREIAAESGYSTGALAHYFRTKDDILRSALERADHDIRERLERIPIGTHPTTKLRHALAQALPLDDRRSFELSLDVNFWARALNQPALRALQHRDHDTWRDIVLKAVVEAQEADALDATRSAEDVTDVIVAFVDGLGLQGLVYPELITAERTTRLLDAQLLAMGADPDHLVDLADLVDLPDLPDDAAPAQAEATAATAATAATGATQATGAPEATGAAQATGATRVVEPRGDRRAGAAGRGDGTASGRGDRDDVVSRRPARR